MNELERIPPAVSHKPKEELGALWTGIALAVVALAIPAWQAVLWLKTGAWTPFPIASAMHLVGWRVPTTNWVGLQKLVAWVFDLPALVIPAFLAFGAFSAWNESLK